jgi:hypothetical protein
MYIFWEEHELVNIQPTSAIAVTTRMLVTVGGGGVCRKMDSGVQI